MKTSLVLVLVMALLALAAAKPHNEGKRPHLAKRGREHKLTNRMDHHRRDHGMTPQHRATPHRMEGRNNKSPSPVTRRTPGQNHRDTKKDLHLQHVTEHNLNKKHEEKLRRGMSEAGIGGVVGGKHLVTNRVPQGQNTPTHILTNRTPQVPNANATRSATPRGRNASKDGIPMESERLIHVTPRPTKAHKIHHKPSSPASPPAHALPSAQPHPTPRPKSHRPPKKYSPKKHGWKKTLRNKDKNKDKVKEKREKRDKRYKALQRAIAAKRL